MLEHEQLNKPKNVYDEQILRNIILQYLLRIFSPFPLKNPPLWSTHHLLFQYGHNNWR